MRYYFLFFFVFCVLFGGALYLFDPSDIQLSLFQTEIALPLAGWILGGILLFFLGSLLFFVGVWIRGFLYEKRLKKDLTTLTQQICTQVLQKNIQSHYKTQELEMFSHILNRLTLIPNLSTPPSQNPKIDTLWERLESMQNGEWIKEDFELNTPFWEQNLKNKAKADLKFAQKMLEEDYSQELKDYALDTILAQETLQEKTIQTLLKTPLTPQNISKVLETLLDKGYRLGKEDFLHLLTQIHDEDLFYFLKRFKDDFNPDFCLALFQELSSAHHKAQEVYAYLLLDYSMFDKAQEFIAEHEDLILPKAYLDLKNQDKNYPLEAFFNRVSKNQS